ncbi:hypothetical protein [Epilithonimonas sp. UC225_85]|uniref:hypothetical protein n=1 Tax=Epilithonimonas sp. UC225_85 TaxID=3350167 RepID=UPI0036D3BD65
MKYYLSILILVLISCKKEDKIGVLNFKSCTISYPIYAKGEKTLYEGHSVSNEWELESAKYQLALCLCEEYLQKPSPEVKDKILKIYHEEMKYYSIGSQKNLDFDSVLKNRKEIFDATILVD